MQIMSTQLPYVSVEDLKIVFNSFLITSVSLSLNFTQRHRKQVFILHQHWLRAEQLQLTASLALDKCILSANSPAPDKLS